MQPLARTPLRRVVAVVMAVALVLGMVPAQALADVATRSVSGVDALETNASEWELLRLDGFKAGDTVYIDVACGDTTLVSRQPYAIAETASDDSVGDALLAHIVKMSLGTDGQTVGDVLGAKAEDPAAVDPAYTVTVRSALRGDDKDVVLYRGTVYPVYAKLVASDGQTSYRLMGIRTASETELGTGRNLGAGLNYYLQDGDGYRTFVRSGEGVDNAFANGCFVVEYREAAGGSVSGAVNYVTSDGTVVKETAVGGVSTEGLAVPVERAFFSDGVYYRALSLVSSVLLTPEHATAVVRVVPVKEADAGSYQVKVRYVAVDENGDEQGDPLWTDTLDVVGKGYNYTVPTTFSQRTTAEDRDGTLGHYTEMYTLDADDPVRGGEDGEWEVDPKNPVVRLEANTPESHFGSDKDGRTLTVAYRASSQTKKAAVTVYEVDGSTNQVLGPKVTLDVTPDKAATYTPEPTKVVDGVTYELWHGNDAAFTCSWDDIAAGADLMRTVYYVPEGYVPGDPYDVTIRYVNVADNAVLDTATVRVSPDDVDWTLIEGPERFDRDGETYVRLAGQEGGVRHSYFSPTRTYTVYYRNVNDVLNGQVVVRRTQIIDTVRDVVVPGTALPATDGTAPAAAGTAAPGAAAAAPAGLAATPAAAGGDAGVTPGDGTTIINDDDNPLASPDGATTAEQRIEDDENPLARGPLSNGYLVAGSLAGLAALFFLLFWLFRRRKQAADTTDPNA